MDELDILKKQWKSQERDLPKLSYDDIYKMLLKKSSSIVKWIFFISIAEILFWSVLSLFLPESSTRFIDNIGLHSTLVVVNVVHYSIFAIFIFLFYRNYRKIAATDFIKTLMQNILRTRKTVKYFVIYNVAAFAIYIIGINLYYYFNQDMVFKFLTEDYGNIAMPQEQFMKTFIIAQIIFGIIMVGLIILFYRIVYGILLRKLHKNFKELEKIDAQK